MELKTIKDFFEYSQKAQIERVQYLPYRTDLAKQAFAAIGETLLGTFDIDKDNTFVIENLIKWAHADNTMQCLNPKTKEIISADLTRGIYLAGPTGTGKTILMKILAEYLLMDNVMFRVNGSNKMLSFANYSTNTACDYYQNYGDLYPFLQKFIICFMILLSLKTNSIKNFSVLFTTYLFLAFISASWSL